MALHRVGEGRVGHLEHHLGAVVDVVDVAKWRQVGRAVPGDPDRSALTRQPRVRVVAGAALKLRGLGSLDEHVVGVDARDPDRPDRVPDLHLIGETVGQHLRLRARPVHALDRGQRRLVGKLAPQRLELAGELVLLDLAVDRRDRLLPRQRHATSARTTIPAVIRAVERIRSARATALHDGGRRSSSPATLPASDDESAEHTPIASYEARPGDVGRVLLLYSGGLDTSVMLRWIQERYGAEVVALTVDLGQPGEDWEVVRGKALDLGAVDAVVVDAKEQFAGDYVLPAIKANALYGGGYPLFTALGRPLIAKLAVEHARESGCDTIAHGCTGKGNDQVRIEGTIATLDPELKVIAPVRQWQMGREEEIAYAREHGIPIKGGTEQAPPYSIDDNLWGRSSEGDAIEDLSEPTPRDAFDLVTAPEEAPDEPEMVRVGFERGAPVSLDGERLGLVELIERAAALGARHGVGIVDHIEDRIVGLKVRDLYEVPAAAILLPAHQDLEKLVSTIHQNNFKHGLDRHWAYLCYAGLWHEPLRARPRRVHGLGERARHRRGDDEALQGLGDGGRTLLAERPVRPHAGVVRRVRRGVLPAGEPGVHRAVHAPEPDGGAHPPRPVG